MTTTPPTTPAYRLRPGLIVLLAIISVANVLALVIAIGAWSDEASHGGDLEGLAILSTGLAVVALVGIGGAWARREWGPPLYFGAQVTGFLLVLFTMPDAIGPLSLVPLVLAGWLWALAR